MQANKRDLEPLTTAARRERRKGTLLSIDGPLRQIRHIDAVRCELLDSTTRHSGKRDGDEQRSPVKDILNPAG